MVRGSRDPPVSRREIWTGIVSEQPVIRTRLRKASGTFDLAVLHTKALMCLPRDTSDQLVQSRKQEL
jgi:hypothetical protein